MFCCHDCDPVGKHAFFPTPVWCGVGMFILKYIILDPKKSQLIYKSYPSIINLFCINFLTHQLWCPTDPTHLTCLSCGISYPWPQTLDARAPRCRCVSEHMSATWLCFPIIPGEVLSVRILNGCYYTKPHQSLGGEKLLTVNRENRETVSHVTSSQQPVYNS